MKRETLEGLAKILKENKKELGIDEKIINDYCLYFENLSMFGRDIQGTSVKFKKAREIFDSPPGRPKLNFKAMIECWPRVADFLFEHHNFYSKLPAICRENYLSKMIQENKTLHSHYFLARNKENILPESISDLEISEIKTIFDNT